MLMLLGFCVRLKIKDGFVKSFPSFFYMALNAYLFWYYYKAFANCDVSKTSIVPHTFL